MRRSPRSVAHQSKSDPLNPAATPATPRKERSGHAGLRLSSSGGAAPGKDPVATSPTPGRPAHHGTAQGHPERLGRRVIGSAPMVGENLRPQRRMKFSSGLVVTVCPRVERACGQAVLASKPADQSCPGIGSQPGSREGAKARSLGGRAHPDKAGNGTFKQGRQATLAPSSHRTGTVPARQPH